MPHADLASGTTSATAPTRITLPVAEARNKAREIISQASSDGVVPVVEKWRQRSDGQIEFDVRNLQTSD